MLTNYFGLLRLRAFCGSVGVPSVVLIAGLFSGCFRATQPGDEARATFYITGLGTYRGLMAVQNRQDWSDLPTHQIFSLKACVAELPKNNPVQSHRFQIFDGGLRVATATSDPSGCVNWQETIGYNVVARPVYLTIERRIVADGKHQGVALAKFAINPWAGVPATAPEDPVVDITTKQIPENLAFLVDAAKSRDYMSPTSLAGVPPVDMIINSVAYKFRVDLQETDATPTDFTIGGLQLRTQNMQGQPAFISINKASFKYEPIFTMQKDPSAPGAFNLSIPAAMLPVKREVRVNGGPITDQLVPVRMNLQALPQFNGEFQLSMIYEPTGDFPAGIRKRALIYQVGSRGNLAGGVASLTQASIASYGEANVEDFTTSVQQFQLRADSWGTQVSAPIWIDTLGGSVIRTESKQRQSQPALMTLVYAIKAPLRNIVSGASWGGKEVRIIPVDPSDKVSCGRSEAGPEVDCKATVGGTLMWQHTFAHPTYTRERWVEKRVRIMDLRTKLSVENCFWVQVLATGGGITSPCEIGPPGGVDTQIAEVDRPFIKVNSLTWERLNVTDYKVDRSLDLRMTYPMKITVGAEVIRRDNITSGMLGAGGRPLVMDQYYGITMMLLRNDPTGVSEGKILTSAQVIRKYEGGPFVFEAPIELTHWVGLLMSGTNYLFVEVVPVHNASLPPDLLNGKRTLTDEDSRKYFIPETWDEQMTLAPEKRTSDMRAAMFYIPTDMSKVAGGGTAMPLDATTDRAIWRLRFCDQDDQRADCKTQAQARQALQGAADASKSELERARTGIRGQKLVQLQNRLDSRPLYAHHKQFDVEREELRKTTIMQSMDVAKLLEVYKQDPNLKVNFQLMHYGADPASNTSSAIEVPLLDKEGKSTRNLTADELRTALSCMDQYSWAPELDQQHYTPKCYTDLSVQPLVLSLVARLRSVDQLKLQPEGTLMERCWADGKRRLERFAKTVVNGTPPEDQPIDPGVICTKDNLARVQLSNLTVDERTFVYDIDENIPPGAVKGWMSGWSVSSDFTLANFDATDRGNMRQTGIEGGVNWLAFLGGMKSLMSSSNLAKGTPGVGTGGASGSAGKKGFQITDAVSINSGWSHNAYVIDFTRDAMANTANISNGGTLVSEQMEVSLNLTKYRMCHLIRKRRSLKGVMICGPTETTPKTVKEQYYMVYTPWSSGYVVNGNNQNNRWLLTFRGEREQSRFMTALSCGVTPFHQNGNVVTSADVFWRTEAKLAERWRGERGVIASTSVGYQEYVRTEGAFRAYMPLLPMQYFGFRNFVDINAAGAQPWTQSRCWVEAYGEQQESIDNLLLDEAERGKLTADPKPNP